MECCLLVLEEDDGVGLFGSGGGRGYGDGVVLWCEIVSDGLDRGEADGRGDCGRLLWNLFFGTFFSLSSCMGIYKFNKEGWREARFRKRSV